MDIKQINNEKLNDVNGGCSAGIVKSHVIDNGVASVAAGGAVANPAKCGQMVIADGAAVGCGFKWGVTEKSGAINIH